MKRARAEIKRAIEIKPNAHFGRERVQLMVMDWILAKKQNLTKKTLGEWLQGREDWAKSDYAYEGIVRGKPEPKMNSRRTATAEGLSGLIVLGAAWQSPDVFEALGASLASRKTLALRHLALLRCRELLERERPSMAHLSVERINNAVLVPGNETLEVVEFGVNAPNAKTLAALYPKLRSEAEAWNTRRAKWMNARFDAGKHPDTDTAFWSGWKEPAPPSLDVAWFDHREEKRNGRRRDLIETIGVWSGVLVFCTLLSVGFFKLKRRFKPNSSE